MKRIVSFLLLLCMLSTACVVCAAESKSDFTEESWMMEPFSSKLVLNSSIVGRTVSWSLSSGYTAYRVWVANTTTNQMKVTVTEPTGNKRAFYVAASGNKYIDVNNATYGVYTISFDSGSVTPTGTVRVKMSTVSLS